MNSYVCMYVCMYVCILLYMYMYVYVCMCNYILAGDALIFVCIIIIMLITGAVICLPKLVIYSL